MAEVHLSPSLPKRGRSADSRASAERASTYKGSGSIPGFLDQPNSEIRKKFDELEWMQRSRISAGMLAGDAAHQWALESDWEVKMRNRYMNVQAWANSRIHLKVPEGECDFINASPIVLRDSDTQEDVHYIATQGPKSGHLEHFWNMIYHETGDVAVVVMLTQTSEAGKEKCAQYFPLDLEEPTLDIPHAEPDPFTDSDSPKEESNGDEPAPFGKITLLESSYDETCRSEVRKFTLTVGSNSKTIWHYLFAGWSDYNKPEGADRQALLELTRITAEKAGSPDNPRIVHCSAGVGRTGTFIALDHLLRELKSGTLLHPAEDGADAVFDTVNQLREQRMMMVYNDIQYQFIYEVLREQAYHMLLGHVPDTNRESGSPGSRSQKMAKLSSDIEEYQPMPKEELEPTGDYTPDRSENWSIPSQGSDNGPQK